MRTGAVLPLLPLKKPCKVCRSWSERDKADGGCRAATVGSLALEDGAGDCVRRGGGGWGVTSTNRAVGIAEIHDGKLDIVYLRIGTKENDQ